MMTSEEAAELWNDVILRIRAGEAKFQLWRQLRPEIEEGLREYTNNLLRGLSQGVVHFATYSASPEAVVAAPRMKVSDADFIFVYKADQGYNYFGVKKLGDDIIVTSKDEVKLGFAGALSGF